MADGSEDTHAPPLASESTLSDHQMRARGDPFERGEIVGAGLGPSSGGPQCIIDKKAPVERVAARKHLVLRERALRGQTEAVHVCL